MSHSHRALSTLLLLSALTTGCSTLNSDLSSLLMLGSPAEQLPQELPPGVPSVTVVMVAAGEEPVSAPFPIQDITHVQTALERTGLQNRFGRMQIELYRPLDGGNHKLDIAFDRAKRQVPPGFDYALHPGDRLVVTEDTSTVVDDMLNSLNPFD